MDIGTVIRTLKYKEGARFKRQKWEDGRYIFFTRPEGKIMYKDGDYTEDWVPTQRRILAEDWEEIINTKAGS